MKKNEITVREFLKDIGAEKIFSAAEEKYELYYEVFMALMRVYNELTAPDPGTLPPYFIRYMVSIPKKSANSHSFNDVITFCGLVSVKSNRSYQIRKSRVKSISEYANAKVELTSSTGEYGISLEEQALLLLLSFCVLDEDVIDAYAEGEAFITADRFIRMIKCNDEDDTE